LAFFAFFCAFLPHPPAPTADCDAASSAAFGSEEKSSAEEWKTRERKRREWK
jgi:hypothetical protein